LSQWSLDDANACGPSSLAQVSVPVLVVGNTADDACTPSHTKALFDAVSHESKARVDIKGANHYYMGQPELAKEATQRVMAWLREYNFPV
jgi:alpha-beta hydrolase superfamily lysophospholipase